MTSTMMLVVALNASILTATADAPAGESVSALAAFSAGVEAKADAVRARQHFKEAAAGFDREWSENPEKRTRALALNRGRSHFLAGNLPMAIVAFRAGLREMPYDLQLQQGLTECRATILYPTPAKPDERITPDPPRGWRQRISEWDNFRLACLSLLFLTIGLARRWTTQDRWAGPVAGFGVLGVLVCLIVAWKLDAEREAELEYPNLVVNVDSTLRKGNGFTHSPRMDATLPRGSEVRERSRRGGWIQVEVAGGAVGWLPESAARPVE